VKVALISIVIGVVAIGVASGYDLVPLPFTLLHVFENGKNPDDILIARNVEGTAGAPVGPNAMVVSSDGDLVYIVDTWQRKQKYFDGFVLHSSGKQASWLVSLRH
jgi:hypothetical protein